MPTAPRKPVRRAKPPAPRTPATKPALTRRSPGWKTFVALLEQKVNFRTMRNGNTTWTCDGKLTFTRQILRSKFPGVSIEKTIKYLQDRGGYCDCEVLMNVDPR
jgi:hypothetical protein